MAGTPGAPRAFFGRRKGHRLRERQSGLMADLAPRLLIPNSAEPLDPGALFAEPVDAVRLEIGFGGGEHLAAQAESDPHIGFIGCEPFANGMAKLLARIADRRLCNIRLFDADAALLLPRLPDGSIDAVFLLYPDPWPKRRHHKRRFVSEANLAALARIVRPGGVFRFASDIDDYVGWTLARVMISPDWDWSAQHARDWREPFPRWSGTRYEGKARRDNRIPAYLTIRRR